jgi:hypothetical protein
MDCGKFDEIFAFSWDSIRHVLGLRFLLRFLKSESVMSSLKAGVLAGLATILMAALAVVGGMAILRNTSVLASWTEKPAQLKPVTDEQEAQAKQPLPQVWERYVRVVPYYADEFPKVLSSRLRHRQFDDLESFANEIRSKKSTMSGGQWVLSMFYGAIIEPAAGADVDEKGWKDHFALIEEWKAEYPRSITAQVVHARSMVNYAWKARGTKYASKVSEAQWALFYDRLDAAKNILVDATELDESCPVWYSTMLTIANGEGWERDDYMKTFNEAVEFEPTYGNYYHQLAVYLSPKWHGKPGEWAAVLAEVANKQGTDEAYAMLQITFAAVAMEDYDYDEIVAEIQKYWPQIKRGFHAREKLYKVSFGNMNDFTRMAYIAGDREEARVMFPRIKDHVNLGYWEKDSKLLEKAQVWARETVQPFRD